MQTRSVVIISVLPWRRNKQLLERTDHAARLRHLHCPNPLKCLVLLCKKDTALIVTINGILYATYCCVQASLALLFIEIYHFKDIQAGLIYLPFGCGCALASLISGKYVPFPLMSAALKYVRKDYGSRLPLDR